MTDRVQVTWKPDAAVISVVLGAGGARAGVNRLADLIVEDAVRLSPIDEGDLRSTIRHGGVSGNGTVTFYAGGKRGAVTGKMVDYAHHVEYGTGRGPAQPYLRPAIIKNRGVLG